MEKKSKLQAVNAEISNSTAAMQADLETECFGSGGAVKTKVQKFFYD